MRVGVSKDRPESRTRRETSEVRPHNDDAGRTLGKGMGHRMRAAWGAGLVLALGLGGCRSSSPDTPADAGPPLAPDALRCETLLPPEVREYTLPGFSLQEERPCPTCGPLCTLRTEADPEVRVSLAYDCRPLAPDVEQETLLGPTLKAGGVQLVGMGRAAARRAPAPGMLQVLVWDDDTPCAIVVTWLGGNTERAVDVARTALHATTPASLLGTPASLASLPLPPPPVAPLGLPIEPPVDASTHAPADASTPAPP